MSTDPAPILRSLERAGEIAGDITPRVYARLFADHPEMEALFVGDKTGAARGEMLSRVVEAILDFLDQRAYADHLIQCEVVTHEGYGVPRDVFGTFFETLAATLRDILGTEWTDAMEASWTALLTDLAYFVENPDQGITAAV